MTEMIGDCFRLGLREKLRKIVYSKDIPTVYCTWILEWTVNA